MAITPDVKSVRPINIEFFADGIVMTLAISYKGGAEGTITKKLTSIRSIGGIIKAITDVMKDEGFYE